jgi:ketosteroid isomerase-like protein
MNAMPHVAAFHELHGALASFSEDADSHADNLSPLFDRFAAPDVSVRFVGQEFMLARDLKGLQAVKEYFQGTFLPAFYGALDTTKPVHSEPPIFMGSHDSEWSAVEMRGSATTKNGKPWVNEVVLVVRSNKAGKWVEVKVYMDTLHLQTHLLQAK